MKALKTVNFVLAIALFATTAYAQTDANWAYIGGDIGNNKYSALDQINAGNIKRLKIVWRAPAIDPAAAGRKSGFGALEQLPGRSARF